ncbi:unnamed protein product [Prorocentrum cordatum]|uniref:C2H2-type domain-containing protein n=1 Tax=Prorocentrum cordatum TaxID=2364126 RepID=A0ABN9VS08_9DINO|nr:unnamed protein product [Polarella glacialis]
MLQLTFGLGLGSVATPLSAAHYLIKSHPSAAVSDALLADRRHRWSGPLPPADRLNFNGPMRWLCPVPAQRCLRRNLHISMRLSAAPYQNYPALLRLSTARNQRTGAAAAPYQTVRHMLVVPFTGQAPGASALAPTGLLASDGGAPARVRLRGRLRPSLLDWCAPECAYHVAYPIALEMACWVVRRPPVNFKFLLFGNGADEALSARVVRHLDGLLGIEGDRRAQTVLRGEVTRAVLGRAGSREQKLDVQVTYLRRVHHFCFYSARWCEDAWDLERRCGAVFLRGAAEDGEVEAPADAGPGEARERAIERFLGEARLERVEPCEPAEQEVASLCQQRTLTVAEGKYRCCECRKLFCGPEFVEKHLRRAHVELFEPLRRKAQEEAMCRAFSAHC